MPGAGKGGELQGQSTPDVIMWARDGIGLAPDIYRAEKSGPSPVPDHKSLLPRASAPPRHRASS